MDSMVFFSLQGLGNSIINFPILNALRGQYDVQAVCFDNGSSAFFKAFHKKVVGVGSRTELLNQARTIQADSSYATYPTWRRELSSTLLSPARHKYLMRPLSNHWAKVLWAYNASPNVDFHDLENNLNLLNQVPGNWGDETGKLLDLRTALGLSQEPDPPPKRILGIHPTASTVVKYYSLTFWRELLSEAIPHFEEVHLFCGAQPVEFEFCRSIVANLEPRAAERSKIFPNLDFATLTRMIDQTSQFIGSDSALMHLAAAIDKPVLGLWSFANFRVIYPYGNQSKVYLPRETLSAHKHEYPKQTPDYIKRASGQRVAEIILNSTRPDFDLLPRFKNPVGFYEF